MRGRRFVTLFVLVCAFLLSSLLAPAVASAGGSIDVLLSDLSSPKGLALSFDGDPIVSQGAFGPPGPVLAYILRGSDRGSTVELSDPENLIDVAIAPDGAGWGIGGDGVLYRQDPSDGSIDAILDIIAYQESDPDPFDQEDNPTESNPYGLAILPSGDALVADAANNDLLRVTPGGDATTVARFDVETISTDHIPGAPLPPTIDAEAVPTSVTLGPDGWVYVGELKGFPFRPGSSHVWAVNPDAEDALCSVNTPDDDCVVAQDDLTSIIDVAFGWRTGTLYVYELAEDGALAFEEGFETGEFPPAVLLEIKKNKRTELAAGQLSEPGGVIVLNRGNVFVTDGLFSNGRLVEIHR